MYRIPTPFMQTAKRPLLLLLLLPLLLQECFQTPSAAAAAACWGLNHRPRLLLPAPDE
jgi:hypothetical protein